MPANLENSAVATGLEKVSFHPNPQEVKWSESRSVVSNSLQPHGLQVHGILQARILDGVAFPFSRGSS